MSGEPLDLATTALHAAYARLLAALLDIEEPAAAFAALGESLWWVFALDEEYGNRYGGAYGAYRDTDPHGSVVRVLRFARNRVGHQVYSLIDFPPEPAPGTVQLAQPTWRELPNLPQLRGSAEQKAAYQRLTGTPVRYSLRRSHRFFVIGRAELLAAVGAR